MYKAEFFSYDVQYKDFALFDDDTELSLDYIAWDASQIKIPGKRLAVIKGDLVHITRDGKTAFDGYVNNVSYPAKNVTQVDVLPLLCSIRFSQGFDNALFGVDDIAGHVFQWVRDRYQEGVENYQTAVSSYPVDPFLQMPFEFGVGDYPTYAYRPFGTTDKFTVYSMPQIFTYMLTTYRTVADIKIAFSANGNPYMHFEVLQSADEITLESDLDNVVERSITLGNSYGSVNKIIIFRPTPTHTYGEAYYLLSDGSVSNTYDPFNPKRIVPVVSTMDIVDDGDDWAAQALQRAKDVMQPKAFDNEIDLTYKVDDALVKPDEIKIGTLATIYAEGVAYQSILTGKVLQNNLIKLIFGSVRVDLTKQLLMERGRI